MYPFERQHLVHEPEIRNLQAPETRTDVGFRRLVGEEIVAASHYIGSIEIRCRIAKHVQRPEQLSASDLPRGNDGPVIWQPIVSEVPLLFATAELISPDQADRRIR